MPGFLLPETSVDTLDAYVTSGGLAGWRRALDIGPEAVIQEIRASGLRGRGGGGFPTGIKWAGVRSDDARRKFVAANGAEGEPGTFKDRALMRANPYQLVEGLAIAAFAVGAEAAFICIKAKFARSAEAIYRALGEIGPHLGDLSITVVEGPDDYLYGEEKAMLEVIEGRDPLPRHLPPYVMGLFAGDVSGVGAGSVGGMSGHNPTVVNNVETLSNVPHIVSKGSDWFRSMGTESSPGTMVFTISGDVRRECVVESEMGTPLSLLVYGPAEGVRDDRGVKAVISGVSNRPIPGRLIETPADFESMKAIGTGLGAGGFVVYDETACMACVGAELSGFLYRGSCGQCPPCKLGTEAISTRFAALCRGEATRADIDEAAAWLGRVTDANRCGLGSGQRSLADGLLGEFGAEFAAHLDSPCESGGARAVPMLTDWDSAGGRFVVEAGAAPVGE